MIYRCRIGRQDRWPPGLPCMSDSPLLVFSDDWGRHPSSCQHLIRHLLPRHSVTWVNTIGTRKPRLDLDTLRRAFGKLGQWLRPGRPATPAADGPRVLNPWMLPWFGSRLSRSINRWLMLRTLLPAIRAMPAPPVVITTIPLVADLIGHLPARRWVYYWVDDFTQWPGYDGETLRLLEADLVRKVDSVVAVSQNLVERAAQAGRRAGLLTHGIDLGFWRPTGPPAPPPILEGLPRPIILFWGLVDRRMDLRLLEALSAHPARRGSVVLVGPQADPDPALARLPGVVLTGSVPFETLPHLAAEASVLIMPYGDMPATRAMQPLKLKEYLATGRPAVVRDLPATREWGDCLDLASDPAGFADLTLRRAAEGIPPAQAAARVRLAGESWAGKALQLESFLAGDGPGGTTP